MALKRKRATRKAGIPRYCEGDLLMVDWVDSAGSASWISIESPPMAPMSCRSVGWLRSDQEGALSLYGETSKPDTDDEVRSIGSRSTIPKVCIRKVIVISKAEKLCR